MNELAGMERRDLWLTILGYFVRILPTDLRRFAAILAAILRDRGVKKSCGAGREGLARGVRSLLRWCGSMGG